MRCCAALEIRVPLWQTFLTSSVLYSWGPSSGAFSVGAQLVANGGETEGLIHAAVMSCGSLLPTGDITNQQSSFDGVVAHAGCASTEDKLQCLREIPAENLTAAAASVTGFFGDGVSADHIQYLCCERNN